MSFKPGPFSRRTVLAAAAAAPLATPYVAGAQSNFPSRPIRLICPAAAPTPSCAAWPRSPPATWASPW